MKTLLSVFSTIMAAIAISSCAIGNEDALSHLTVNDPLFVAAGQGNNVYSSIDGITWKHLGAFGGGLFLGAHYGNSRFLLSGSNGAPPLLLESPSDTGWLPISVPAGASTLNQPFDRFGMVLLTSNNGLWQVGNNTPLITPGNLYFITYGNEKFLVGGGAGLMYTSENGIQWTQITGLAANYHYYSCIYVHNKFVIAGHDSALGRSIIAISADGVTGFSNNMITTPSSSMYGIAYGNRMYVAVGAAGYSWYSDDGTAWNYQYIPVAMGYDIRSIVYGNGMFVAVCTGVTGRIIYSLNGIDWLSASSPSGFVQLYAITCRP